MRNAYSSSGEATQQRKIIMPCLCEPRREMRIVFFQRNKNGDRDILDGMLDLGICIKRIKDELIKECEKYYEKLNSRIIFNGRVH